MGRQLCLDGMPQDDLFRQIWSARALVSEELHQLVVDAHKRYIEAGAGLLVTNAYGVQPTFYQRAFGEVYEPKMLDHAKLAAQLAVQAREQTPVVPGGFVSRIFGCLPPLGESHRPDFFFDLLEKHGRAFFVDTYRKLGEAQLAGGCDGLMLENQTCWEEMELALEAVRAIGGEKIPVIVSMEGALRNPVTMEPRPHLAVDIAFKVLELKKKWGLRIEALGFSCTEPETILECLTAIDEEGRAAGGDGAEQGGRFFRGGSRICSLKMWLMCEVVWGRGRIFGLRRDSCLFENDSVPALLKIKFGWCGVRGMEVGSGSSFRGEGLSS